MNDAGYYCQMPMQTVAFNLTGEYVKLNNLLKLTGLADSGGRAKAMVAEGLVKVDGKIENRKTAKIRAGQVIESGHTRIAVTAESVASR